MLPDNTFGGTQSRILLLARVSIVAAGILAFCNGFDGQFFLDDSKIIIENVRLRHIFPQHLSEWLGPRAMVDFTLAINYATGRLNPADYHAGNLLVHLMSGLILFGLVRRTLSLPIIPPWIGPSTGLVAWVASLVWIVHPLAGAAVQYVCQRYELMAALFILLTLYAILRGATSGNRASVWYVVAVGSCLSGMSCKETMIVTPILALAFDRTFLGRSWSEVWSRRRFLHAGLVATVLYLLLPIAFPGLLAGVHDYQPEGLSLAYLAIQFRVVSQYLRLAVWPSPLCLDYGWSSTPASFGGSWSAVPALLFVALTVFLFVRTKPQLGFLGLAFLLLLAPTSSVFPHPDLAFDHRMYLPLAALAVVWAILLAALSGRMISPMTRSIGFLLPALMVVVALGLATYARNRDFQDAVRMWKTVLQIRPDNTRAAACLTGELYERRLDREVIATAEMVLARTPVLDPQVSLDQRRMVDVSKLLNNLGLAQLRDSRCGDAVTTLLRAVMIAPGNIRARLGLAAAALESGDTNMATREVNSTYNFAPRNPDVLKMKADLLAITGAPLEAASLYRQALVMLPDESAVQGRLAWLLSTCPDGAVRDGAEALRLARAFVRDIDGNQGTEALETLAAALAETGDLTLAVKVQSNVVNRLGPTPLREARLAAYRAGKPWRDLRLGTLKVSGLADSP